MTREFTLVAKWGNSPEQLMLNIYHSRGKRFCTFQTFWTPFVFFLPWGSCWSYICDICHSGVIYVTPATDICDICGDIYGWYMALTFYIYIYTYTYVHTHFTKFQLMVILTLINSSPPWQNGRHFADDIIVCTLMNENFSILIRISMRFVPKGLINNYSALVQIMAWCRQARS